MRFSRLRLLGFKSFVEPAEFIIEQGLTGVVGPNGCGKSNLVEALRWVMGESSYKNMRASGMDDVIFSGSATRPARNAAEVTLFLDNSDRRAPPAFNEADELQVSRRIERESGSLYRINGKEARAKDVQLLFADQSTGARSPSMVGQGRIGELIQAKPQARRALLEEAAGISGLHTRRHEAELRLRAAEQNLERLEDVVGELGAQIENLKRQARQASRFKSLSADIRQSEATLLHLRWTEAKAQAAEAQSALSGATITVAERAAAQMEAAKAQAIGAHKLPELRDAEASAAAALQRLTIARTQIEEETRRVASRQAELQRRLEQLDADTAREEALRADNAGSMEKLGAEEAALRAESVTAGDREQEAAAILEKASASLTASEAALAAATAARAEASAARAQAERALSDGRARRSRLERQRQEVEREGAALAQRLAALPDPIEMKHLAGQAVQALEEAEGALAHAEASVTAARDRQAAARSPVAEARGALTRAETEARTLIKILDGGAAQSFRGVLEQITVERGYETALGAALGEDLDAPLDQTAPVHWRELEIEDVDAPLPEGAVPLARHVHAPSALARRLKRVGLVEAGDGARLQPLLLPGQRLVSRKGAIWRWDGFHASADAPTLAAQRLAQKNRLAELQAEVETAGAALSSAEAIQLKADSALKEAVERERLAREVVRRAQAGAAQARDALLEAERAAGELAAKQAAGAEALARITEALSEAAGSEAQAEEAFRLAPDLAGLEQAREAAERTLSQDRARQADARSTLDGIRHETEFRARRLTAIAAERQGWITRGENAQAQLTALAARRVEAEAELRTLEDAPDEIDARRRALLSELAKAEALRRDAADALQGTQNRQRELDKIASGAVEALAGAREARVRAEERLNAADDRKQAVELRIHEALGVAPHLVLSHAGLRADDPLPEVGVVEGRLERLKIERERLGAVNLRAEEEQRELSERQEGIISERDDVIEAIRTLRHAIHGLNREGRERLLAAFDLVNAQFQRLFTHLFGGGTAELQLIESDDPLEAGLEIMARPPGKRPQTMTLLSGGEQALTAMALIFAVFLTNPAPICVLDEVDAPLDDHNVERFCNLMDEMAASTETRFVVITHNPITMARMNRLFGVTMAEQGVSQLVSVDLQTAERIREAG